MRWHGVRGVARKGTDDRRPPELARGVGWRRVERRQGTGGGGGRGARGAARSTHHRHAPHVSQIVLKLRPQLNLRAPCVAVDLAVIDEDEVRVVRVERSAVDGRLTPRVLRPPASATLEQRPLAPCGRAPRPNPNYRNIAAVAHRRAHQLHHAGVGAGGDDPRLGGGRDGDQPTPKAVGARGDACRSVQQSMVGAVVGCSSRGGGRLACISVCVRVRARVRLSVRGEPQAAAIVGDNNTLRTRSTRQRHLFSSCGESSKSCAPPVTVMMISGCGSLQLRKQ